MASMGLTQVHWYVPNSALVHTSSPYPLPLEADLTRQYTAAAKRSSLDSTSKALAALSDILKKDTKLPSILAAPSLSPDDKSQIVQELQKHTGGADKGDTVKNFLKTLADNNRLGILEGVCDKYTTLMGAARGEVEMTVTSAGVSLH